MSLVWLVLVWSCGLVSVLAMNWCRVCVYLGSRNVVIVDPGILVFSRSESWHFNAQNLGILALEILYILTLCVSIFCHLYDRYFGDWNVGNLASYILTFWCLEN